MYRLLDVAFAIDNADFAFGKVGADEIVFWPVGHFRGENARRRYRTDRRREPGENQFAGLPIYPVFLTPITPLLLLDAEEHVGLVLQAKHQFEGYGEVVAVVGDLVVGGAEAVGELVAPVAQVE